MKMHLNFLLIILKKKMHQKKKRKKIYMTENEIQKLLEKRKNEKSLDEDESDNIDDVEAAKLEEEAK